MLVLSLESQTSVRPLYIPCAGPHSHLWHRKHLLVSLGEECYLTLTKGGLPDTTSSDPQMKELFPIPGGGHVLIVPISHHPTLLSLPPDEAATTLVEVEKCACLHV